LLKVHHPDTLRALLLSSHYRRPIDFGPHRLDEIERALQTFYRAFERFAELTGESFDRLEAPIRRAPIDPAGSSHLGEIAEGRQRFLDAMDDDFNTGGAFGALFEIVHALNRFADQLPSQPDLETPSRLSEYRARMVVLKELSLILGLFRRPVAAGQPAGDRLTGPLIDLLLDLRGRLRKEKNFGLADQIRNRLSELGVMLEDRPDGTRWRVEQKHETAARAPGITNPH
jgi:cysteinyl-tRNA synthetase